MGIYRLIGGLFIRFKFTLLSLLEQLLLNLGFGISNCIPVLCILILHAWSFIWRWLIAFSIIVRNRILLLLELLWELLSLLKLLLINFILNFLLIEGLRVEASHHRWDLLVIYLLRLTRILVICSWVVLRNALLRSVQFPFIQ